MFLKSLFVCLEDVGVGHQGYCQGHFVDGPACEAFRLVVPQRCEVGVELGDVLIGEEL